MASPPRVLVLGLNYPPERTGIAPYTGSMARGLARRGFDTRVLTTHPHYPAWKVMPGYGDWSRSEQIDGVAVTRLRHYVPALPKGLRRVLSEISFGARASLRRWGHADALVVVSPGLISSLICTVHVRLTHRTKPLIVWVQDLYTLGMTETGETNGFAVRVMRAMEGRLLRSADRIVVIHDRFATRVADDFGVRPERIEVIRNWTHLPPSPEVDVAASRRKFGWAPDETIVLHAGNMGVKQGLENVVRAARIASERGLPVRFVLLGHGAQLDHLKTLGSGLKTLEFTAPLNDADFAAALASADSLLVNELPGISEMAVPSKLTSYFSAGRPVVAATDLAGITAEEIHNAGAGVVVRAGDPESLLNAVLALAADPSRAATLGQNGRQYRKTVLDEESAIDRFTEMLAQLVSPDDGVTNSVPPTLDTTSTI
ncbi:MULTISPECIES: glycosyltransferase family 4 protein [unclassified Microbacterium]|uniref:glycosyltransferase family 4 protein n=1 Tax=unclassified Microbacterium TaxID=2609290 RepID=UPI00214C0879|nr:MULTISPECIES: glycosyltransferase family 4 protein [unclassified Microbacterium]MCR2808897.1 glycosyltransferase family 4 protein [Microbacterium sp. zg.B185]WIM18684.1 glycosyltransferase family 4 protein [Microbacterium sp. zg-B185]